MKEIWEGDLDKGFELNFVGSFGQMKESTRDIEKKENNMVKVIITLLKNEKITIGKRKNIEDKKKNFKLEVSLREILNYKFIFFFYFDNFKTRYMSLIL